MSKCLVLFVEGDTEVEFYRRVISKARQKRRNGRFDINIECKNVKASEGLKILLYVSLYKMYYNRERVIKGIENESSNKKSLPAGKTIGGKERRTL